MAEPLTPRPSKISPLLRFLWVLRAADGVVHAAQRLPRATWGGSQGHWPRASSARNEPTPLNRSL